MPLNNVTALRENIPPHSGRALIIDTDGTIKEQPKELADVDRVIRLFRNGWSLEAISQEMKLEVGVLECMLLAKLR